MRRSSPVCCDASLVVLAVTRATRPSVHDLWERWRGERRRILAPALLRYEVTNALHQLCLAGELSRGHATEALEVALALPITYETGDELHHRALEIAARFNRLATSMPIIWQWPSGMARSFGPPASDCTTSCTPASRGFTWLRSDLDSGENAVPREGVREVPSFELRATGDQPSRGQGQA